jgi:hypothetical protein
MIKIIGDGTEQAIITRASKIRVDVEDADFVFYCDNKDYMETKATPINANVLVLRLMVDEKAQQNLQQLLDLSPKPTQNYLYALYNKGFSQFLEVSYDSKFMTGGVGVDINFAKGAGIPVPEGMAEQAIPNLTNIEQCLNGSEYRGEVTIGISDDFQATSLQLSHSWGMFAMYGEIVKGGVSAMLDFLTKDSQVLTLYDTIVLSNLISQFPFPVPIESSVRQRFVPANPGAEKHLWRMERVPYSTALVTTHGVSVGEAQRRLRRTLNNSLAYDSTLQFRVDYGVRETFTLMYDKSKDFYTKYKTTLASQKPSVPDTCK